MVLFHMVVSADLSYYLCIIAGANWRATDRRCSMAGWMTGEMRALLGLWGAADLQAQLNVVVRKKVVYQKIAGDMNELGYHHTHSYVHIHIDSTSLLTALDGLASLAQLLMKALSLSPVEYFPMHSCNVKHLQPSFTIVSVLIP